MRHQRSTLRQAKAKVKEVCECLATGKREVLEWNDDLRIEIRHALKLLEGTVSSNGASLPSRRPPRPRLRMGALTDIRAHPSLPNAATVWVL